MSVEFNGRFFDPFPASVINDCLESVERLHIIPERDPLWPVQQTMFNLGFWPTEPNEQTTQRLSRLREVAGFTAADIQTFITNNRETAGNRARTRITESLKQLLAGELNLYGDNVPEGFRVLYQKVVDGKLQDLTLWERALIFRTNYRYKRMLRDGIYHILSAHQPIVLSDSLSIQLKPNAPLSAAYFHDPSQLKYDVAAIEALNQKQLPVMTHTLVEGSLKEQIFLGALGGHITAELVSFSAGRVFVPSFKLFEIDKDPKWVMFFAPQMLINSGLVILPDLNNQSKPGENEVYTVPPIDLSLCIAVVSLELLEQQKGWKRAKDNKRMVEIPQELLEPNRLQDYLETET